ncbi:MAG: FkbM family methyltransferase [Candidatus Omnitrophica bacterium]|nr:FkbM family methyltransferase [Candidatus Omnitrophota bacterium]
MTTVPRKTSPFYYFLTSKEYRTFLGLFLRYGAVLRYQPKTIQFLKYKFLVTDCASFIWQFREIFFEQIYKFNSQRTNPVIYDCGANIGTSCLYFKQLYPQAKIYAFEADPKIYNYLQNNLKNNGITGVELSQKAVWSSNGKINFGSDGADGGAIDQKGKTAIEVDTIRLKELFDKEEYIDFLKMDIEGAEVEVMSDCAHSLSKIENIFIEFHSWNHKKQQLGELLCILSKNNFRYYLENIKPRKIPFLDKSSTTSMDLQMNIFAYRNQTISKC